MSIALGVILAFVATGASHSSIAGPPPPDGWFATNQEGFCALRRIEHTLDLQLEFLFYSGLRNSDEPQQVSFQVNASPAKLARPVRLSPGTDVTAPDIEVGADSNQGTALTGVGIQQLLAYLKAGEALIVKYTLIDGVELRLYLDTLNFPQSLAMFEACTAHVA